MTMKKRIKTAGALTLAAITVLSAAGLSSVYGALGVETDRKCSLTFTLDDTEFDELRDLEIPVDVYKVADITEEAVYDTAKYGTGKCEQYYHRRGMGTDGRGCHEDRRG